MKIWKHPLFKKYGPWAVLAVVAISLGVFAYVRGQEPAPTSLGEVAQQMQRSPGDWLKTEKDGGRLAEDLRNNNVVAAGLAPDGVIVSTRAGEKYFVSDMNGYFASALTNDLADKDYQIVVLKKASLLKTGTEGAMDSLAGVIEKIWPTFILIGLLIYMTRNDDRSLGKTLRDVPDIKFADVIGATEAKAALGDIMAYLKDPAGYAGQGIRAPKGVLMLGGPGVGKTMLAKAVAGECGVSFISVSGSDFTSKWFGMGMARVRNVFKQARKNAPCILFIDELDGVAKRSEQSDAASAECNRIINQLLVEMDGFADNAGVVVIGATNLPDNIEPALLREGRIDRRVTIKLPDVREREALFRTSSSKLTLAPDVDFAQLSRLTTGLSPATITTLVNQSALLMVRDGRREVTMADMLEAIEVARIGEINGSKSMMSQNERHRIAAHEAGHAIVAVVQGSGHVEKVTILPRGGALGVTLVTPDEDKSLYMKSDIEKRIQMLLGGRNAELAMFDEASSGAAQDLQEASRLAMDMVGRYGFGQAGRLFSVASLPDAMMAFHTQSLIEAADEVLQGQNVISREVLEAHRDALQKLTAELLLLETVSGDRVRELVGVAVAHRQDHADECALA
ncbi:AAA family ATPase [Uliginosibacterium sp. sgz301328]|uniref:AAA family ATPase n=1 Tax=Uliginosibacterium sp. sgz301328 TaxID=3243764 RepID=UPI00359E20B6